MYEWREQLPFFSHDDYVLSFIVVAEMPSGCFIGNHIDGRRAIWAPVPDWPFAVLAQIQCK